MAEPDEEYGELSEAEELDWLRRARSLNTGEDVA